MPRTNRRGVKRDARIGALAKRLAIRFRVARARNPDLKILKRKERKRPRLSRLIAYDFETTSIRAGTPQPLYITAFGHNVKVSEPLENLYDVLDVLNKHFLLDELNRAKFIAWNGNNFDVFIIAAALLHSDDYILRPYLTRGKSLRGLRVIPKDPVLAETHSWEFLDGMAMLGMVGKKLSDFLKQFAPDYLKIEGAINFDKEEFDPNNAQHVEYAERDSEGLWHGMMAAQQIVVDHFRIGLSGTIGNLGIKIFQSFIPERVKVREPSYHLVEILKNYVMRGGYCYSVKKYDGPVWKYDLNQAYAAAMRDARLPCGDVFRIAGAVSTMARAFIVRLSATNPRNKIPFYYRSIETDSTVFGMTEIKDTWITSLEYEQLLKEKWQIKIIESWNWSETFDMREYVNKLEHLRVNAPGGPKSPQGEIMKAIGNNSYGKTVETLDGLELVLANQKPDGFAEFYNDDERLSHIWFRFCDPSIRDYHQPQLGCFITAHVRMVVRRAALLNPDAWIYADTDCVVFTQYVPLQCDSKKYGFWKIESEGDGHIFITKKVYAKSDGSEKHAKGLNKKNLSMDDFRLWFQGIPPLQEQLQRNNFVKVMAGSPMYRTQKKYGQKPLQNAPQ